MKSFKTFQEGIEAQPLPVIHSSEDGKHEQFSTRNVNSKETRDEMNIQLLRATNGGYTNPHIALNNVAKLLAVYGILVPKAHFPAVDAGEIIWSISPHGDLQNYNPSIPGETEKSYFLYFEYGTNSNGVYVCYAEIVDADGLDELMEDEVVDGESLDEGLRLIKTHTNGEDSAKVYKDAEWGEHRVKFFKGKTHLKNSDYHTDDVEDAHKTAQHQLKSGLKEDHDEHHGFDNEEDQKSHAHVIGAEHAFDGKHVGNNPFKKNTPEHSEYLNGHKEAHSMMKNMVDSAAGKHPMNESNYDSSNDEQDDSTPDHITLTDHHHEMAEKFAKQGNKTAARQHTYAAQMHNAAYKEGKRFDREKTLSNHKSYQSAADEAQRYSDHANKHKLKNGTHSESLDEGKPTPEPRNMPRNVKKDVTDKNGFIVKSKK